MKCPRCMTNEMTDMLAGNALSRKDNETYVCSPCGEDESIMDFAGIGQIAVWPLNRSLLSWSQLTVDDIKWLST